MDWEAIGGGLSVAVDTHCRVSQDGLLLAKFAAPLPTERAVDLGSGNGLVPLWWCRRDPPEHILAVEREDSFAALLRSAVERFSLSDRIDIAVADWNDVTLAEKAQVITCNPPYFAYGSARLSDDPLTNAARHEDTPDLLERLCQTAARLMSDDGRFCLCHRPERLVDVMNALQAAGLNPRRLQFVQAQDTAAPWLLLCEAAKRGTLRVLPTAVVGQKGDHTDVYRRIYT